MIKNKRKQDNEQVWILEGVQDVLCNYLGEPLKTGDADGADATVKFIVINYLTAWKPNDHLEAQIAQHLQLRLHECEDDHLSLNIGEKGLMKKVLATVNLKANGANIAVMAKVNEEILKKQSVLMKPKLQAETPE